MNAASVPVCRFARCLLPALLLSSCAMPPRDAWRIVQTRGLFNYLSGNYAMGPGAYVGSGAPLQTSPRSSVPYRPFYAADLWPDMRQQYRQVPHAPPPTRYVAPAPVGRYSATAPLREPRRAPAEPRRRAEPEKRTSVADSKPETRQETPNLDPVPPVAPPRDAMDSLPYGTPIAGRPGMVNSPFARKEQLVDVSGMGVGEPVKCPYTGKLFRIPPTQQAAATKTTPDAAPAPKETSPAPAPSTAAPDATTPPPAQPDN